MSTEIIDAFSKELFANPYAIKFFEGPYIAHPYPIYGIKTKEDYIFDDSFWDVFHAYPFHICHVAWLREEDVYEIRFKIAKRPCNNSLHPTPTARAF